MTKIAIIFFSGTHVTEEYAGVIRGELARLGCDAEQINFTAFAARQKPFSTDDFDAFIFGMPVYADFPPSVMSEWIPTLDGKGKPCAMFVSYGGRTPGHAQYHIFSLLTQAGFGVRLSAEFLGRHTFNLAGWELMTDRPNDADFGVAREFAEIALARFDSANSASFSLQKTFGYDLSWKSRNLPSENRERKWTQPVRVKDCSMCGVCEAECPAQAMDTRSGASDPAKCIECMHCMYVCPENALQADDRIRKFYPAFLKDWGMTEEILNHKQSRVITGGWEAAA
ncbi:MAG: EFR1 family ferrodoxin [Anaerolineales bacterium]